MRVRRRPSIGRERPPSNGIARRLAAVNVSAAAASCALPAPMSRVLHGAYADGTNDGTLALNGYGYVLAEA